MITTSPYPTISILSEPAARNVKTCQGRPFCISSDVRRSYLVVHQKINPSHRKLCQFFPPSVKIKLALLTAPQPVSAFNFIFSLK
jgi:hypothetical protein